MMDPVKMIPLTSGGDAFFNVALGGCRNVPRRRRRLADEPNLVVSGVMNHMNRGLPTR